MITLLLFLAPAALHAADMKEGQVNHTFDAAVQQALEAAQTGGRDLSFSVMGPLAPAAAPLKPVAAPHKLTANELETGASATGAEPRSTSATTPANTTHVAASAAASVLTTENPGPNKQSVAAHMAATLSASSSTGVLTPLTKAQSSQNLTNPFELALSDYAFKPDKATHLALLAAFNLSEGEKNKPFKNNRGELEAQALTRAMHYDTPGALMPFLIAKADVDLPVYTFDGSFWSGREGRDNTFCISPVAHFLTLAGANVVPDKLTYIKVAVQKTKKLDVVEAALEKAAILPKDLVSVLEKHKAALLQAQQPVARTVSATKSATGTAVMPALAPTTK